MALNIEAIEAELRTRRPVTTQRVSALEQMCSREDGRKGKQENNYEIERDDSVSINQLEAYLFVSRLKLDSLYEHVLGGPVAALHNIDNIARLLPPTPGVYFICANSVKTEEQEVIYVGMTESGFDKRLSSSHHALKKISGMRKYSECLLSLKYTSLYPGMDIDAIEGAAISYFDPPVNVVKTFPNREVMQKFINRAIFLFQQDVED
jgi:hypothetical protein